MNASAPGFAAEVDKISQLQSTGVRSSSAMKRAVVVRCEADGTNEPELPPAVGHSLKLWAEEALHSTQ
jgi:hypothetical protein